MTTLAPNDFTQFQVVKEFACRDSSGTFVVKLQIQANFVIGHAGFQIFGTNGRLRDVPRGLKPSPFLREWTIQLWPSPSASVRWPPPRIMTLDLVKRFAQWDQPDPIRRPR